MNLGHETSPYYQVILFIKMSHTQRQSYGLIFVGLSMY